MNDERAARLASVEYDYATQPKVRVDLCNLCGGRVHVTVTHRDRYGFAAAAAACTRCGLVFLDPRLDAVGYAHFYDGVYRRLVSAFHGRRIDAETVEGEQVPYAAALVELLEPALDGRTPPTILDVGGSTGIVAEAVRCRFGGQVVVVDPAPAEVERARRRGLSAVVGTIETYEHDGPPVDLVLLCQTIDHLLDIAAALAKTRAVIAEDGLLFVDIVDFRAAYLRASSVEAAIKIDHPYSLTEDTAEAYLARAGFRVVTKDYAPDHLHVGYVCAPSEPRPDALPRPEWVRELLREVRLVQNAPYAR